VPGLGGEWRRMRAYAMFGWNVYVAWVLITEISD
jgi:hypothetical protein